MVDDEDAGVLQLLAGVHVVAGFVEGAAFAGAVAVFGADGGPDVGVGLFFEFLEGAVADAVVVGGLGEGFELAGFGGVEEVVALSGSLEAEEAEVVGAAFDEDGVELGAEHGLYVGKVFVKELFLEGDGVGGDDGAGVAFLGGEKGGDEVGVAFADAGAGFDGEVMWGGGGFGDGVCHFLLLGAVVVGELVLLAVGFEGAAGFEKAVGGLDGGWGGVGIGGDHEEA